MEAGQSTFYQCTGFTGSMRCAYKKGMQAAEISASMEDLLQWDVVVNDQNILLEGIRLKHKLKIPIWDAFIVAAAIKSGARHIISEDLSHMKQYEGIIVTNPFLKQ